MTEFTIVSVEVENFTAHKSQLVKFGEKLTRLRGSNGVGKSSIGAAPAWCLFGTDLFAKKYSPVPVEGREGVTSVRLLIVVDGVMHSFKRETDGKKNTFYVGEVPATATEFENAVSELIDRDEFLSFYNPLYFFTLHWTKQREIVMKRMQPPARKDILTKLPEVMAKAIEGATSKYGLDDAEKVHRDAKNRLDKEVPRLEGFAEAKRKDAESAPAVADIEGARVRLAEIDKQISELGEVIASAREKNADVAAKRLEVQMLERQRDSMKEQYVKLKANKPADICHTCRRPLEGEDIAQALAAHDELIDDFKRNYQTVIDKKNAAQADLDAMQEIDVEEAIEQRDRLKEERQALLFDIERAERWELAKQAFEGAAAAAAKARDEQNASVFILNAIKEYRAKEAELQAVKVNGLFENLSVRLFDVKKNGEVNPDFEIQMNGKDFSILSTGERVKASIELHRSLSKEFGYKFPLFIDSAESYTGAIETDSQVIAAYAVPNLELQIETE